MRVIAATNVSFEKLVAEGNFLPDLYYRLNVVPIVIPALKEHPEDIPGSSQADCTRLNQEYGEECTAIDPTGGSILKKQ